MSVLAGRSPILILSFMVTSSERWIFGKTRKLLCEQRLENNGRHPATDGNRVGLHGMKTRYQRSGENIGRNIFHWFHPV